LLFRSHMTTKRLFSPRAGEGSERAEAEGRAEQWGLCRFIGRRGMSVRSTTWVREQTIPLKLQGKGGDEKSHLSVLLSPSGYNRFLPRYLGALKGRKRLDKSFVF